MNALKNKDILEGYRNNRSDLALNGLSNNCDFVQHFKFAPVLYPVILYAYFVLKFSFISRIFKPYSFCEQDEKHKKGYLIF